MSLGSEDSPVIVVDRCNWDDIVSRARHTVLVKFFAPWCRFSAALEAVYDAAAVQLEDLVVTAAVDCDNWDSISICELMGIEAFPTIKIFIPENGNHPRYSRDFTGERKLEAIIHAAEESVVNVVAQVQEDRLPEWHSQQDGKPTAVFYSPIKSTSAILKAVAIDLFDIVKIAQVNSWNSRDVERLGLTSLPALVVYPGGISSPIVYRGDWSRVAIIDFLLNMFGYREQDIGERLGPIWRPFHGSEDVKNINTCDSNIVTERETLTVQAPTVTVWQTVETLARTITVRKSMADVESPTEAIQIYTEEDFRNSCLQPSSDMSILIFSPSAEASKEGSDAPTDISNLIWTFSKALSSVSKSPNQQSLINVVLDGTFSHSLRIAFGLRPSSHLEIIALNAKGKWIRRYSSPTHEPPQIQEFIDSLSIEEQAANLMPIPESLLLGPVSEKGNKGRLRDEL